MATTEEERRKKLLAGQNPLVKPSLVQASDVAGVPAPSLGKDALIEKLQQEIQARNRRPDLTSTLETLQTPGVRPGERKIESSPIKLGGDQTFSAALAELEETGEIRPETQKVLDEIRAESGLDIERRVSTAQAFAEKRGLEGSSIEQAEVGRAITEGERARREAELPILTSEIEAGERARLTRAQAGFGRAAAEAQAGFQAGTVEFQTEAALDQMFAGFDQETKILATQLKADELATVRNLMENNRDRDLQKYLGERGIAISRQSINAAREAAQSQAKATGIIGGATIGASVGGIPGAIFGGIAGAIGSDFF